MKIKKTDLAVELVQIICSRLKILATPNHRAVPEGGGNEPLPRASLAANILKGQWEVAPEQKHLLNRLRYTLMRCHRSYENAAGFCLCSFIWGLQESTFRVH